MMIFFMHVLTEKNNEQRTLPPQKEHSVAHTPLGIQPLEIHGKIIPGTLKRIQQVRPLKWDGWNTILSPIFRGF